MIFGKVILMNTASIHKHLKVLFACILLVVLLTYPNVYSYGLSEPAVYCGLTHSMALKEDGTVWAWGNNVFGQLGDGSSSNRYKPVQVIDLKDVKAIACKDEFSYALDSNNHLYAWGRSRNGLISPLNESGRSSFSRSYDADHPILLKTSIIISKIACSYHQFCGYEPYSKIFATSFGELRMSSYDIKFVSIVPCGYQSWLGLDDKGQVWFKEKHNTEAEKIYGLNGIISIAGDSHYAALKSDGTVWTWGNNASGQLGDGTLFSRPSPQKVTGIENVCQIAAAGNRTVALKKDGTVWEWGLCSVMDSQKRNKNWNNTSVQAEDDRKELTKPTYIPELSNIKFIAAGIYHCLAIKEDGTVWAWGYNDFGELGDGTNINRARPVMINDFNLLLPTAGNGTGTK